MHSFIKSSFPPSFPLSYYSFLYLRNERKKDVFWSLFWKPYLLRITLQKSSIGAAKRKHLDELKLSEFN
jgi:hypothetical protein